MELLELRHGGLQTRETPTPDRGFQRRQRQGRRRLGKQRIELLTYRRGLGLGERGKELVFHRPYDGMGQAFKALDGRHFDLEVFVARREVGEDVGQRGRFLQGGHERDATAAQEDPVGLGDLHPQPDGLLVQPRRWHRQVLHRKAVPGGLGIEHGEGFPAKAGYRRETRAIFRPWSWSMPPARWPRNRILAVF